MGKFAWPVWETLNATSPEVIADFPHVWGEFMLSDLLDRPTIVDRPISLCTQCFVLRCNHEDQNARCLFPVYHGLSHLNENNHRWTTSV